MIRPKRAVRFWVGLVVALAVPLVGCGLILNIPDDGALGPAAPDASATDGTVAVDAGMDAPVSDVAVDASIDAPVCDGAVLDTDPHNCGACGHDCLSGACGSGVCQPVLLTVSVGTPIGIAVAGPGVYWTSTNNTVQEAPIAGGNAQQVATDTLLGAVAADAHNVYFVTNNSGVSYVVLDGGLGTAVALGSAQTPVSVMLADGGVVSGFSTDNSGAFFCPTPPSLASCTYPIQQNTNNAGYYLLDLKVDSAGFVWSSLGDGNGELWSCPPTGCYLVAATQLFDGAGSQVSLAITPSDIFWIDSDGGAGRIRHCERGNCQAFNSIVASGGVPHAIAVDTVRVYWTDPARGRVLACPLGGCNDGGPDVIAEGGAPNAIALDDTAIYWTDVSSANAIVRVAKP